MDRDRAGVAPLLYSYPKSTSAISSAKDVRLHQITCSLTDSHYTAFLASNRLVHSLKYRVATIQQSNGSVVTDIESIPLINNLMIQITSSTTANDII